MADLVRVSTTVSFKPINVPKFVQLLTGEDTRDGGGSIGMRLESLDASAIDALAGSWLEQLYLAAGQVNTWTLKKEKKAGANG